MDTLTFLKKLNQPIFKLAPGLKEPLKGSRGFKDATRNYNPDFFKGFNIGIALGNGLLVIDFDPRNYDSTTAEYLDKLHELFPDTICVETPSGGFHLYYNYDPAEIEMKSFDIAPGIQLLAEGKYSVAPSSYYRELDTYYRFKEDLGPTDIPLETLPDWITNEALERARLRQTMPEASVESRVSRYEFIQVETALMILDPDMEEPLWRKIGACLHSTAHPDAFDLFNRWSQKATRTDSRGNSIYSESACLRKWKTFHHSATGSTWATIFKLANRVDSDWEIKIPRDHFDIQIDNWKFTTTRKNDKPHPLPAIPLPHFDKLVTSIYDQAPFKMPYLSIATALSSISAQTQMRYLTPTFGGMSTYLLLTAKSGSGKSFFTKYQIQCAPHKVVKRPASAGGLHLSVQSTLDSVMVDPEFNQVINKISNAKDLTGTALANKMTDLYDLDGTHLITGDSAKMKDFQTNSFSKAALSIFATCTPGQIEPLFTNASLLQGFSNRFLIINDLNYKSRTPPSFQPLDVTLFDEFAKVVTDITPENRIPLTLDKKLRERCYSDIIDYIDQFPDDSVQENIVRRFEEQLLRVASNLHIYEEITRGNLSPHVTPVSEIVYMYAFDIVKMSLNQMVAMIPQKKVKVTVDAAIETHKQKIVKKFADKKTMTRSDMTRGERFRKEHLRKAIDQLKSDGVISVEKKGRATYYTLLTDDYC